MKASSSFPVSRRPGPPDPEPAAAPGSFPFQGSAGRATAVFLVAAVFLLIMAPACRAPGAAPPWLSTRPLDPAYLYGVGTSGRTLDPERMLRQAVERAVWEICFQARGVGTLIPRFKEEKDGAAVVELCRGDRVVHVLDGVEILSEYTFPRSVEPEEGAVAVLVRIPRAAMHW